MQAGVFESRTTHARAGEFPATQPNLQVAATAPTRPQSHPRSQLRRPAVPAAAVDPVAANVARDRPSYAPPITSSTDRLSSSVIFSFEAEKYQNGFPPSPSP